VGGSFGAGFLATLNHIVVDPSKDILLMHAGFYNLSVQLSFTSGASPAPTRPECHAVNQGGA
jgi:hypothetical protein